VVAYFALTVAISWVGAVIAIGGAGGMRGTTPSSDPRFVYALMAMLAGQSVTGILLTSLVAGPWASATLHRACSHGESRRDGTRRCRWSAAIRVTRCRPSPRFV
jgi:hypothetical protein